MLTPQDRYPPDQAGAGQPQMSQNKGYYTYSSTEQNQETQPITRPGPSKEQNTETLVNIQTKEPQYYEEFEVEERRREEKRRQLEWEDLKRKFEAEEERRREKKERQRKEKAMKEKIEQERKHRKAQKYCKQDKYGPNKEFWGTQKMTI